MPADNKPDSMRYGLVGEDTSSEAEKLSKYTGQVGWEYLRPHHEAGVLYFVDPQISLQEVGAAFGSDDTAAVEAWLKRGDLVKIEAIHAAQWQADTDDTQFEALVVSPFVLFRPTPKNG